MIYPTQLKIVVGVIVFIGVVAFFAPFVLPVGSPFPTALMTAATFFTLAALVAYVYFTYMLAEDNATPSASLNFMNTSENPYQIVSILQNHSNKSLRCWCDINAEIYGQRVGLPGNKRGFYDGMSAWFIQPGDTWTGGGFSLIDILSQKGMTLEEMEKNATPENLTSQLHFNVHFWYFFGKSNSRVENDPIPYYFDFKARKLIGHF